MEAVLIVDFEDSFTHNISEIFYRFKIPAKVVNHKNVLEIEKFIAEKDFSRVIVWGPGPGHPDEYLHIFPLIKKSLLGPKLYVLGICLGHQLIWYLLNKKIVRKDGAIHGVSNLVTIPNWPDHFKSEDCGKNELVQYYNSLEVADLEYKDFGKLENGITFQFHPESIGTQFPELFFNGAINHLKQSSM